MQAQDRLFCEIAVQLALLSRSALEVLVVVERVRIWVNQRNVGVRRALFVLEPSEVERQRIFSQVVTSGL